MNADNSSRLNNSRIETNFQSNTPTAKPHFILVQAYSLGNLKSPHAVNFSKIGLNKKTNEIKSEQQNCSYQSKFRLPINLPII